ncbi:hypothetical protein FSP39_017590 [Pinctada imbricata]|uniref:DDE Tnp4 domain-containing protein n=1 Tax=Pinctada imbricata TaxID=66713 RepID=A0AA88XNY5_PINIB|nr:hypothetical protein FSP39_017590 [Pinctada imbricata]
MSWPTTPDEWRAIAEEFSRRWNMPHAVGALDGEHVACKCPKNSGSQYYNYKGFFSIVLMGLVDAEYKFTWVDVGADGSASGAQIFIFSELKETIENRTIGFPRAEPLPNDDKDMPFFILGDDAFALRTYMMKPFSHRNMTVEERIFNYRISRGRRIAENAFGILANRFQVLLTTMQQDPETIRLIVQTCVCLHNLMRIRYPGLQNAVLDQEDDNHQVINGAWRNDLNMQDVDNVTGPNRATRAAKSQREYLKHYFNSNAGSVPWQNNMI